MHAIFACAVLSLKKWKNAVLSDKNAFFFIFFQKKNFGRAAKQRRMHAKLRMRCDANSKPTKQMLNCQIPPLNRLFPSPHLQASPLPSPHPPQAVLLLPFVLVSDPLPLAMLP